ncbi:hypothetical protein GQ54DRAFT_122046 [Martensiomyces pterosporus]|nr:hypothetical protein GQ54DRAFT_122046 [Martensiomyces pterosporus]
MEAMPLQAILLLFCVSGPITAPRDLAGETRQWPRATRATAASCSSSSSGTATTAFSPATKNSNTDVCTTAVPKQQPQLPPKKTSVSAAMNGPRGPSKKPFGHLVPSGLASPTDKMMSPATRGVENIRHKSLKNLPPPQRLFEKFEAIKQQQKAGKQQKDAGEL